MQVIRRPEQSVFERLARRAAHWAGSTWAFSLALLTIAVWLVTGPLFNFSDTWQLVINTGTTIITFLMVFLIQRSQNIDASAIQLKLNEIVAAMRGASNRLINIEDISEEELVALHEHFSQLAELSKREHALTKSHTIEEAQRRHEHKHGKPETPGR
jgi:low affinity Fe/Cu permease